MKDFFIQLNESRDARRRENTAHVERFPSAAFVLSFCRYLWKITNKFLAYNFSSSGRSHVGSLFTNEEQKKAASWRIWYFCHTCRPSLGLHWYRLLGTKLQYSQLCFWLLLNTDFIQTGHHFTDSIQTAGNKAAVFTVVFLAPFKHRFHTDRSRNQAFLMKLVLR